jgi:hypothetical protein
MKKPWGSTEAKHAASARPGFQPSAAAQSTAIEISSGRIVRMVSASIGGRSFQMCDFSRHDERRTTLIALRQHPRDADVHSPEMAHFFAQNILVPCDLFSEN